MKFKNVKVYNFENALRGMRNPKDSWHLSDSEFGIESMDYGDTDYDVAERWVRFELENSKAGEDFDDNAFDELCSKYDEWLIRNGILDQSNDCIQYAFIGPKDMRLAKNLIKAGPEHRKFMRQIFISVDITAPLYW